MNAADVHKAQRAFAYRGLSAGIGSLTELAQGLERVQLRSVASLVQGAVEQLEAAYSEARELLADRGEVPGGPVPIASRKAGRR